MEIVKRYGPRDIGVLIFDFAGCGRSTGEYISLGHFESEDFYQILHTFKHYFPYVKDIILWGRSMGAVTSLMY